MDAAQTYASAGMKALASALRDTGSADHDNAVEALKDFLRVRSREERVILPEKRELRATVLGVPVYDDDLDLDSREFRTTLWARAASLSIQLPAQVNDNS